MFIHIEERPDPKRIQKVMMFAESLDKKLKARGDAKITFWTVEAPLSPDDVYQNDIKIIAELKHLLNEIELHREVKLANAEVMRHKIREVEYWKDQLSKAQTKKRADESRLRELELDNLKLKMTVRNLIERRKSIETRIRDVRNGWKYYREQIEREKRKERALSENIRKLSRSRSFAHDRDYQTSNRKGGNSWDSSLPTSGVVMDLISEKEVILSNVLKLTSFVRRVYDCLERLKASDGNYPVEDTFLVDEQELDEIKQEDVDYFLTNMNQRFKELLNEIRTEPFGSDDTFKFKRIGRQKQQEVIVLEKKLSQLQQNYDRVVKTMEDWKKWKENEQLENTSLR
jgi:hypothetical protein